MPLEAETGSRPPRPSQQERRPISPVPTIELNGTIVFPKSTTPARIEENFELFDFRLHAGDVEKIDALDGAEAGRIGANPDTVASIPPDAVLTPER